MHPNPSFLYGASLVGVGLAVGLADAFSWPLAATASVATVLVGLAVLAVTLIGQRRSS